MFRVPFHERNQMKTTHQRILLSLAVLLCPLAMSARASEIPSGLEPASVTSRTAAGTMEKMGLTPDQVQTLDLVELAQVEKSDPSQQGGDAIITVAVIAAIVIIVYIAMQHMDHV